jgi:hypothetical protein
VHYPGTLFEVFSEFSEVSSNIHRHNPEIRQVYSPNYGRFKKEKTEKIEYTMKLYDYRTAAANSSLIALHASA